MHKVYYTLQQYQLFLQCNSKASIRARMIQGSYLSVTLLKIIGKKETLKIDIQDKISEEQKLQKLKMDTLSTYHHYGV